MLTAVTQDGSMIKHASKCMQSDREVVSLGGDGRTHRQTDRDRDTDGQTPQTDRTTRIQTYRLADAVTDTETDRTGRQEDRPDTSRTFKCF